MSPKSCGRRERGHVSALLQSIFCTKTPRTTGGSSFTSILDSCQLRQWNRAFQDFKTNQLRPPCPGTCDQGMTKQHLTCLYSPCPVRYRVHPRRPLSLAHVLHIWIESWELKFLGFWYGIRILWLWICSKMLGLKASGVLHVGGPHVRTVLHLITSPLRRRSLKNTSSESRLTSGPSQKSFDPINPTHKPSKP